MPDLSASRAALRAPGHWLQAYLTVFKGIEVLEATVSAAVSFPALNLTITVVDGSASNVRAGMRIDVYSSGGSYKGSTRVRYAGTISSTNLPIRELSQAELAVANGDTVYVYNDIRLSDKLVADDPSFAPDELAYTDQGSNPPPRPASGGVWVGDTSMLPAPMVGSDSELTDPDSATTPTHNWSLPTGLSFASGSSSSADPTIEGDAGEYVIAHTVTDPDNSKSIIQNVRMRIHDDEDPPLNIVIESLDGNAEDGWTYRIRVFGTATQTAIPDGSFVVLWAKRHINGTVQSFGAKVEGRSHILGVGYLRREEGASGDNSEAESLVFEVISPMARLQELPGFSKVMTSVGSPDNWGELKTLTVKRGIVQIPMFYTNLFESGFDLIFDSSFDDRVYPQFFIQKNNPLAQMRELADGCDARITCDRTGRFFVHTRPELMGMTERTNATKTLTLTSADVPSWRYRREHWEPIEVLECRGFTAGSSPRPIFSRAPGTPGLGNESLVVERLIADSQSNLNNRCGRRWAARNGVYIDANGIKRRALTLDVPLRGSYDVFDFYDEFTLFDLTTTRRGLVFSNDLFYLQSVSLGFRSGTAEVSTTWQMATHGLAGRTYVPPQETDNGLPPFNPPSFSFPPILSTPVTGIEAVYLYKGTQRIALICANGLALTTNFGSASATDWSAFHTWASLSVSGTVLEWVPDGFTPGSGWLVTSTGVYYGALATPSFTLKHTFATASLLRAADASFGAQNRFVVVSYYESTGTKALYTTDNSTFTEVTITTHHVTTTGQSPLPGCFVSSRSIGRVYTSAHTNTAAQATAASEGKVSTDGGATWGSLASPLITSGSFLARRIHVPWHDNDDELIAYWGNTQSGNLRLFRSIGTSQVDISPSIGGTKYGPGFSRNSMETFVGSRKRMLFVGQGNLIGTFAVFLTEDADAATPTWTVIDGDGSNYRRGAIAGDNGDTFYLWGVSNAVGVSADGGATIIDQSGNLSGHSPGAIIGLAGY